MVQISGVLRFCITLRGFDAKGLRAVPCAAHVEGQVVRVGRPYVSACGSKPWAAGGLAGCGADGAGGVKGGNKRGDFERR